MPAFRWKGCWALLVAGVCVLAAIPASASALIGFRSTRCESDIRPGVPLREQPPSFGDCGPAIWTISDDGAKPRRITTPENIGTASPFWLGDREPALSPSGHYLATTREIPEGGTLLRVYSVADRSYETVSPQWPREWTGGGDFDPAWSPDESQLVFASTRPDWTGRVEDVYTLELRTRTLSRLTSYESWKHSPEFSPDGREVVFAQHFSFNPWEEPELPPQKAAETGAFAIGAAGEGGKRQLTTPGFAARSPTFSPDGTRLAIDAVGGLYVMNVDGSELRLVVADEPEWRGQIDIGWQTQHPVWGGQETLIFSGCKVLEDGRGGCAIFKQRVDDPAREPEQLTNWSRDDHPTWAPGGGMPEDTAPTDDAAPSLGLMNTDAHTATVATRSRAARLAAGRVFRARRDNLAYFGADGAGLGRIEASIARTRKGGRCTFVTRSGGRKVGRCSRPVYFRVAGPAAWRAQMNRLKPDTRYSIRLRARDVLGNRTRRPRPITVLLKR